MATIGQIYHNILDPSSGSFISSSSIDIYDQEHSIVAQYTGTEGAYFTKISIQTTPGTQIVFNENKTAIVGRTGIYDLDNVKVTSMYFIKPIIYIRDDEESDKQLIAGEQALREAWLYWKEKIGPLELDIEPININIAKQKQDQYQKFRTYMETYMSKYDAALATFNQGDYGMYKKDATQDGDLYNVIVDFIYET